MGILTHDEILRLHAAIISAQLVASRSALLVGVDGRFVAGLPRAATPGDEILSDLGAMNEAGALADGSVPLAIWLKNAAARSGSRREEAIFRESLSRCHSSSSPATSERGSRRPAEHGRPTRTEGGSISGNDLLPSRAFFVELDRVRYSQVAWSAAEVDAIQDNLERKLKLLSIVKGHVVIPVSHLLESELAREILLDRPELFQAGVVVPALRSDYPTCQAFLESKLSNADRAEAALYSASEVREMAVMLDATARLLPWSVDRATSWFRNRLLYEVEDDRSLLSAALRRRELRLPPSFRARLEESPVLSRGTVYELARTAGPLRLWELMCNYVDFLYYLGGARVVESEGVLPQENLVDFSLDELVERRTRLSENEVFFKIFIDVVKAATSAHFPADLLDAMAFDELVWLHDAAISGGFVEKYNLIQAKSKDALPLRDSERLILHMEEIEELERELHRQMQSAVERELPQRLRHLCTDGTGATVRELSSLATGPPEASAAAWTTLVGAVRIARDADAAKGVQDQLENGIAACAALADASQAPERPVLLSFVNKLKTRYIKKVMGVSTE